MFRTFFLLFVLVVTLSFVGCGSKSGNLKSSAVKTASDNSAVDSILVAKMEIISSGNTVFVKNPNLPFCEVGEKFVIVKTRTGWGFSNADLTCDTMLRISGQNLDFRIAKISEIIRTPNVFSVFD